MRPFLVLFLASLCLWGTLAFQSFSRPNINRLSVRRVAEQSTTDLNVADSKPDQNELIAKRIIVEGNVQGGYYRSCVLNEVRTV